MMHGRRKSDSAIVCAGQRPEVRGWGHQDKRAHVRKLLHQLDGWFVAARTANAIPTNEAPARTRFALLLSGAGLRRMWRSR
jgi:hypothetical protein